MRPRSYLTPLCLPAHTYFSFLHAHRIASLSSVHSLPHLAALPLLASASRSATTATLRLAPLQLPRLYRRCGVRVLSADAAKLAKRRGRSLHAGRVNLPAVAL